MDENEKKSNQNDDIHMSLGTAVFIAILTSLLFLAFVLWVSLKIEGMV